MVSMAGIHGLLVMTSTRRVVMLFLFYSLQSDAPTPLLSTLGSAAALVSVALVLWLRLAPRGCISARTQSEARPHDSTAVSMSIMEQANLVVGTAAWPITDRPTRRCCPEDEIISDG